jgi:prolyl-tRNA editing enzyme YbaK/EbsC (Cys-tRNA(Pro) deacylase)
MLSKVTTPPTLGTLTWLPALDHPELLAVPVQRALTATPVDAWVAAIDPSLADTAEFCATYEVPLELSANCVVVAGRRADVTTMAACLVLATDRADVNKTVRKHLDVRKISFAPMDEAVTQTGMEYGGITPIGLPTDWPVMVDEHVAAQPWIVIGSGIRGSKIAIQGSAAAGLPGAEVLVLAISPTS